MYQADCKLKINFLETESQAWGTLIASLIPCTLYTLVPASENKVCLPV